MKKLIEMIYAHIDLKHFAIIFGFIALSLGVNYPVLQNKILLQSDAIQYSGMSRQLQEHRQEKGEETYWVDNAFGGMPTYQIGAKYPYDILTPIHKVFRLLPHPTYLLFLYLLGAYVFLSVLGLRKRYAVLGALAYGLSTYLLIIIQVGHNTKAQALGYLPFVFAGIHYLFRTGTFWGIVLTSLAMAMQIRAIHYHMTYYMLYLLTIYVGFYAWENYKLKKTTRLIKSLIRLGVAGILAIALNATSLLATSEYTKFSTRGQSELTLDVQGAPMTPRTGLPYDYITQFSYGLFESFNLIIPRIQGGASTEDLGTDSSLYENLIQRGASPVQASQFTSNVPTYWGDQPILEAPAYIGLVVVFLALLALFFPWSNTKQWLLGGILLSLLLSWGKNFPLLTQFFIDYVPLYTKFRAVSSIQVILEFCFPVLAMIGLHEFYKTSDSLAKKSLKKCSLFFLGLLTILSLLPSFLSFIGGNDAYYTSVFGTDLMQKIVEARAEIYWEDLARAWFLTLMVIALLFAFLFKKMKETTSFIAIALLLVFDLLQISNRYLDQDLYVSPLRAKDSFIATPIDLSIQQDNSYYRVYEPSLGLQGARTAYFHNTVGGYHGAKPRRLEEFMNLFQAQQKEALLNILNIKYVIYEDEEGQSKAYRNPSNLGAAWFVGNLIPKSSPDDIYQSLTGIDFKKSALIPADYSALKKDYVIDSLATVELNQSSPNVKTYNVTTDEDGFVVFSEMYYESGWRAYIGEKETPIYPVNYLLRGIQVPKGNHIVKFEFQPMVIKTGGRIQLMAIIFLLGLVAMGSREEYSRIKE